MRGGGKPARRIVSRLLCQGVACLELPCCFACFCVLCRVISQASHALCIGPLSPPLLWQLLSCQRPRFLLPPRSVVLGVPKLPVLFCCRVLLRCLVCLPASNRAPSALVLHYVRLAIKNRMRAVSRGGGGKRADGGLQVGGRRQGNAGGRRGGGSGRMAGGASGCLPSGGGSCCSGGDGAHAVLLRLTVWGASIGGGGPQVGARSPGPRCSCCGGLRREAARRGSLVWSGLVWAGRSCASQPVRQAKQRGLGARPAGCPTPGVEPRGLAIHAEPASSL